ncbi:amino acid adenylation domain-containing protein [Micromonospora sp. M71_S20]|uniref:amino acid adenylation domain-containing protein n=1 Tax=Micromonospora sp. M71_S20 TaxID=592872 RepID=UPI000EB59F09|nr:amino acid adenylation domain-containing protein [Micromonospora sp. M71_S20]RLK09773.1 amino acid adenylation domain-containing protein [Micromonospora sp. M71_S20]
MTPADGAGQALVHQAVARSAEQFPHATALVHQGSPVEYAELHRRALAVAARLGAHGIGAGAIVPLCAHRCPELVAAQLGVLWCGAAYTTIDPRWPTPRRLAITDLVGAALVLTTDPGQDWGGRTVLPLTATDPAPGPGGTAHPPTAPGTAIDGEAAATVVFTSGTTGRPKGVVLPHRALTRMFRATPPPGFGPGHAMPQGAPPWWDMYSYELFGQLMTGGTSLLVDGDYLTPGELRRMVEQHGATTLRLTTSLFALFVDEDLDSFAGLGTVLVGGERLPAPHAARFLRRHPRTELLNGYGPTESCMHATTHRVRLEDCADGADIPLGSPVPATTVLVLDGQGRICPPGKTGEICVAGDGLATCYLGEPELTAGAFVPVEIGGETVRAYRTGDYGLIDPAGLLRFRGRRDRQLKVGGHRIEPAEVEAAARQSPGVRDCTVTVVDQALALFYVPGDDPGGPAALRRDLLNRLPRPLVPTIVRALDRFPLTPNGKLDRDALANAARTPTTRTRSTR